MYILKAGLDSKMWYNIKLWLISWWERSSLSQSHLCGIMNPKQSQLWAPRPWLVVGSQYSSSVSSNHPQTTQTSTTLCFLSQKEVIAWYLGEISAYLSTLGLWNVVNHQVSHKISQGRWRTLKFQILVGTGGGENRFNPPARVPLTESTTDKIWFWLFGVGSKQQLLQGGR